MRTLLVVLGAAILLVIGLLLSRSTPAVSERPDATTASPTVPGTANATAGATHDPAGPFTATDRTSARATQGLTGRVVDARKTPIAGAHVYAFLRPARDPLSAALAMQRGQRTAPLAAADSDANGAFTVPIADDAAGARLELHVLARGHADAAMRDVRANAAQWFDLGTLTLAAGTGVRGVVRDLDTDRTIADAEVTVTLPRQDGLQLPGRADGLTARTDANGAYQFDALPAGPFAIAAQAPGHARVELPQQQAFADEPSEIDFVLPAGRDLSGFVLDEGGRGIADAYVTASLPTGSTARCTARTDRAGAFALAGLPQAAVRVRAGADGYRTATLDAVAVDAVDVRLVLAAQGSLHIRVRAADGAPLGQFTAMARGAGKEPGAALRRRGPLHADPAMLVDGALAIQGLDAGDYEVAVEAPGHAKTVSAVCTVTDGARTDVEVTLRRGGGLRGRVVDAAGKPVAGASIATESPDDLGGDLGAAVAGLVGSMLTATTTRSDRDGHFALAQLAAGNYRLRIDDAEHAPRVVGDVTVVEAVEADLGTLPLRSGGRLRGTALVDGRPDATVVVQIVAVQGELPRGTALELRVAADGTFAAPRPLPAGRYALLAGRRDPGNPVLENADRQQSRVELDLADGEVRKVSLDVAGH